MAGTSPLEPTLRVGTSSWSSESWRGVFYSPDCHPGGFLGKCARHSGRVQVNSTFCRIPSAQMVEGWKRKTPEGFLFALKAPRVITHDKVLADCQEDLKAFLRVADRLEERLGPILFQFPYFNRKTFARAESFFSLLRPFLARLPRGYRFAVEVRNKSWVGKPLMDLLSERRVAFALIDHPWMPRPAELLKKGDLVTADFSYSRMSQARQLSADFSA